VALVAISIGWIEHSSKLPNTLTENKVIEIKSGSSVHSIADKLYQEGVIKNHLAFMIKARIKNRTKNLKAGEYDFTAGENINQVIEKLQSGKVHSYDITFPEGLTSIEMIEIINNNEILSGDAITEIPAEGSLLPETYHYTRGESKSAIIKRMQDAMTQTIDKLWEERQDGLPIKTKEEALTLASIIEKETAVPEERARVAGVFINRLNKKIALQTDPTVIYAVTLGKKKMDRELTIKDLKTSSPYNTYMVRGLPPTPIANPGASSIKAALNPEFNDYIYFVADGTGGHVFASTLAEHNSNVAKWRKIKRAKKD